jgi:tRNA modification GTPase
MEALAAAGAQVLPAKSAAPESFPAAHPRWDNPAIGGEMLDAIPQAASELVLSAVTLQWSAGLSELASGALADIGREDLPARLADAATGLVAMRRLLEPAEVVLIGPPNVGKSTLANAIVGRQVSIVHETPGTTRDWVREPAIIAGVPIYLTDTAGLWLSAGGVDAQAIGRGRARAEQADLVLLLAAGKTIEPPAWLNAKRVLRVSAKTDICTPLPGCDVAVSAQSGEGMNELAAAILKSLGLDRINPANPMAFTARQADLLRLSADAITAGKTDLASQLLGKLLRG